MEKGIRKRDAEENKGGPEYKKTKTDIYQTIHERMEATQEALDDLLKQNNKDLSPSEQIVHQRSIEEARRLNTGDYAVNAQDNEEYARYAARRAHLKALIRPGYFSDKQMEEDWKPGGVWAQCAETFEKYKQQIERAERKRQQIEKECPPINTIKELINSSKLHALISKYRYNKQQKKLSHFERLKRKLEVIGDFLEGKPVGIAIAEPAWQWIKATRTDLQQLLNLPHQGGISGHTKGFTSRYGFREHLEHIGLQGKFLQLEPDDNSYGCHDLTFHNGRIYGIDKLNDQNALTYINEYFILLGSKNDFFNNESLYDEIIKKLNNNSNSCIVIYKESGTIVHSSPVMEVYQKDGKRSIMLFGKWGSQPLGTHDIEDVPNVYRDQGKTNWEIYFTDREQGRIMDL